MKSCSLVFPESRLKSELGTASAIAFVLQAHKSPASDEWTWYFDGYIVKSLVNPEELVAILVLMDVALRLNEEINYLTMTAVESQSLF